MKLRMDVSQLSKEDDAIGRKDTKDEKHFSVRVWGGVGQEEEVGDWVEVQTDFIWLPLSMKSNWRVTKITE